MRWDLTLARYLAWCTAQATEHMFNLQLLWADLSREREGKESRLKEPWGKKK